MKNKVELIGYYGSDEIIACSAWTSTSRELTLEKKERIPELIKNLWEKGHHTPFEKGIVHFLVDTDIASHIHLLKHRISSLNAESARYKELKEDKFYLPEDWQDIKVEEKHYNMNFIGNQLISNGFELSWTQLLADYTQLGNVLYHKCIEDLEPKLGRKRAKETARYFKTYNSQIQSDVMFNLRSFNNFLNLRYSTHAQKEINDIAKQMYELVKYIEYSPFEHTLKAWKIN